MPNYKKIYFRMFGTFDIMVNKKSVLSKGFRQQGFNKLFVFFLLNHDRVFEINTLIEKVWPDKEYHDNNSIMRTQIFRLKRQLASLAPSFEFKLEFTHGGYCFSYDPKNVVMDTDIFENLCGKIFTSRQASSVSSEIDAYYGTPQDAPGANGFNGSNGFAGPGAVSGPNGSGGSNGYAGSGVSYGSNGYPGSGVAYGSNGYAGSAIASGSNPISGPSAVPPADITGEGPEQPRAAASLQYRPPSQGAPVLGHMAGPSAGSFSQGRQDRLSGRGASLYTGGIQYSDDEIMRLCSDALRIYQSGFLNEAAFDGSWLESYKQNYRRMWFRIIRIFAHLCYRAQNYGEIITLCQEVMRFEESEEYIHEIYMDALNKSGYRQDALRHYEIITASPARKEALVNSPRLRELHRFIARESENNRMIDEVGLEQYIMELTGETGTVVCEKDVFLRHCSVLRLHSERSTYLPYICIIETIDSGAEDLLYRKQRNISYLTNVVKTVFRKSDVLCEWNDRQLLVLMACKQDFDAEELTRRIKLAIVHDNLTAEDEANGEINLTERASLLPLNVKIMPIGEIRELNEYHGESGEIDPYAGNDRRA